MKIAIKKYTILIIPFFLALSFILPGVAFCNDITSQKKITEELTRSFRNIGWADLAFEVSERDMVSIHHKGIRQNSKLTEGQLVSMLGTILKPDIVSRLKNSGFKKGIFIDGKSRKYPIEISTKYYDELQALCNRLSGLSYNEVKHAYAAQIDEQKNLTKTEFLGDYSKATKKKIAGKVSLVVWKPYIQKLQNMGFPFTLAIPKTRNLTIDCDEIWEIKYTEYLTKKEIKKYWNELEIDRLYWRGGKIQAAVVLKKYISNPITNEKLPKPEYKITNLHSRNEILEILSGN